MCVCVQGDQTQGFGHTRQASTTKPHVYMCGWVSYGSGVYTYVGTQPHEHKCSGQRKIPAPVLSFSLFPLKPLLSVSLEFRLAPAKPSSPPASVPASHTGLMCVQPYPDFMWVLGIQAQVPMLVQQIPLSTEPSPNSGDMCNYTVLFF